MGTRWYPREVGFSWSSERPSHLEMPKCNGCSSLRADRIPRNASLELDRLLWFIMRLPSISIYVFAEALSFSVSLALPLWGWGTSLCSKVLRCVSQPGLMHVPAISAKTWGLPYVATLRTGISQPEYYCFSFANFFIACTMPDCRKSGKHKKWQETEKEITCNPTT